jgi:iron complex outermembrane recepter protein
MILRLCTTAALAILTLVPTGLEFGPAAAAGQVPVTTPPPGDTLVLAPVEVTVLRSVMPLSSAPVAISVRSGDALRGAHSATFLDEVLRGLPGVQVQNRYNPAVGERVAVRGFGARAQFGVRGVRVLVDGIPATLPDGQSTLEHIDLGSLGRVEAVRGPSSALFGNASGGVLLFETRRPPPEAVRVELEGVTGSHGHRKGQGTLTGTVGQAEYLVSASMIGWKGFRTRPQDQGLTYGEADRLGANLRVTHPLLGGRLDLTGNYLDLDAENPGSLPESMRTDPDRPAWNFNIVQGASKQVNQEQGGVRWAGPAGAFDLDLSVFGVRRRVVNPIPSDIIDLARRGSGLRVQVGHVRPGARGDSRLYIGVEAEVQNDDRLNYQNSQGDRGELTLDQAEEVHNRALFLQGIVPLVMEAEAMLGLRWDRARFTADDRFPRAPSEPTGTGRRSMSALSPSLGIHVPLAPDLDLFASFGTFFETPSTTELANRPFGAGGFNPDLDPQRGSSIESGLRGRQGADITWEATAYRTSLRNELIPFEVPNAPGRTYFRNAGTSRHQGVEVALGVDPGGLPLRFDLSYSWTDARFRDFVQDEAQLGGNRVPGVAPHRGDASVRWTHDHLYLDLGGQYAHRIPTNDENTAWAPSNVLWDLRGGSSGIDVGGVELRPWAAVRNLFDRDHVTSVAVNAFGGRYFEPGPGRSFQVGVRTAF